MSAEVRYPRPVRERLSVLDVQVVAPDIHTSPLSPGGPRACYPLRGARALRPASPRRAFRLPHGTPGSALFQQASTHAHETLLWASKGSKSRHTFNYDLINSRAQTRRSLPSGVSLQFQRGRSSTATIPPRNPCVSSVVPSLPPAEKASWSSIHSADQGPVGLSPRS